jgi:hypothetical protein
VINISLLAKWRWRLLFEDHTVWKEVLRSKYGGSVVGKPNLGEESKPWFSSLWWKDILLGLTLILIGSSVMSLKNWVMVYILVFGVMFRLGKPP